MKRVRLTITFNGASRLIPVARGEVVTFGSSLRADHTYEDAAIEPVHCRFMMAPGGCYVECVTPNAEVKHNGVLKSRGRLRHGDKVEFGDLCVAIVNPDWVMKVAQTSPAVADRPLNTEPVDTEPVDTEPVDNEVESVAGASRNVDAAAMMIDVDASPIDVGGPNVHLTTAVDMPKDSTDVSRSSNLLDSMQNSEVFPKNDPNADASSVVFTWEAWPDGVVRFAKCDAGSLKALDVTRGAHVYFLNNSELCSCSWSEFLAGKLSQFGVVVFVSSEPRSQLAPFLEQKWRSKMSRQRAMRGALQQPVVKPKREFFERCQFVILVEEDGNISLFSGTSR